MDFPQFWQVIEDRSNISSVDIANIKKFLTLLGFTTMESVAKLSSKSEMQKIEFEFFKLKESAGFHDSHPELSNENFASGTQTVLNNIAKRIKKGYFVIEVDANTIVNAVFEDAKIVS